MSSTKLQSVGKTSIYLSICIAAALSQSHTAYAQNATDTSSTAKSDDGLEEVVITGYRKSLAKSTDFKKESIGFADGVFSEDMGKFPDTNAAESLNRIPGVTIQREITGEGLEVSVRGLGTSFVKVLLNDAPIAIASTGRTDSANTNREVDLDILPTEFFTQMTVAKSSDASMLEGGPAGTVNMRTIRAFDNPGMHLTYSLQGTKESTASSAGERGSIMASGTWGNFGALLGFAGTKNNVDVKGYETIGLTNPALTAAQCGAGNTTCNSTGGGNYAIPGVVPAAPAADGLNPGDTVDNAYLLAHNPSLSNIQQLDNGLVPRLARPMEEWGEKERVSAVLSLEFKPSDNLHMFVDSMYGRKHNDFQRIDMDWVVRNGASAIPVNETVDNTNCSNGCTVNSATFLNSQFFLEYRPYIEDEKFWSVNPGIEWKISDWLKMDFQANDTDSTFHRQSPTVLVSTAPNSGVTATFVNGTIPSVGSSVDLNNPANFGWPGGRVNIQDEDRDTKTKGVRTNWTWGKDALNLKAGVAYDDISRHITPLDNTQAWQNAVCGDQPNVYLPGPNSQPSCNGLSTATPGAGYPTYPGYGSGYTSGASGFAYLGSLIPNTAISNYLQPGPSGFITVNWPAFRTASNYDAFHEAATQNSSANTGAGGGFIEEKSTGFYLQLNGDTTISDHRVKYSVGERWVQTKQTIQGTQSIGDPRNAVVGSNPPALIPDGSRYPNINNFNFSDPNYPVQTTYSDSLPSAEISFYATDDAVFKAAVSKTMGRADPTSLLPGLNSSAPAADVFPLGNPSLQPFLSENLDFGFDYYTGKEGYAGIMAFRKRLTGFTISQNTTVPFSALAAYGVTFNTLTATQQQGITNRGGADAATVTLQQQVNSPGALLINGIEFNWVQPLDALLGVAALDGLGFTANYTIVDQSSSGAAPAVATGVPPHTFNLTGYYEKNGISVRVSEVFYAANQAAATNQNGLINGGAIFNDAYRQWDLSSSFDLAKMFHLSRMPEVTFDIQNLFNAKQRQYFQFPNATYTSFTPGTLYMVGLRQKF